jgi:hypothetical protein
MFVLLACLLLHGAGQGSRHEAHDNPGEGLLCDCVYDCVCDCVCICVCDCVCARAGLLVSWCKCDACKECACNMYVCRVTCSCKRCKSPARKEFTSGWPPGTSRRTGTTPGCMEAGSHLVLCVTSRACGVPWRCRFYKKMGFHEVYRSGDDLVLGLRFSGNCPPRVAPSLLTGVLEGPWGRRLFLPCHHPHVHATAPRPLFRAFFGGALAFVRAFCTCSNAWLVYSLWVGSAHVATCCGAQVSTGDHGPRASAWSWSGMSLAGV